MGRIFVEKYDYYVTLALTFFEDQYETIEIKFKIRNISVTRFCNTLKDAFVIDIFIYL